MNHKHLSLLLLSIALLSSQPLHAIVGVEIRSQYDHISKADFETPEVQGQDLQYSETESEILYMHPFDCHTGGLFGIGFDSTHLEWEENPWFREKDFYYVNFSLGAYTTIICDWNWKAKLTWAFDTEHQRSSYQLFYVVLWGTYEYRCNCYGPVNLHIGMWGRTGIERNLVLPIVGVDFKPRECIKLTLVFPVDMAAQYLFSDCWSLTARYRYFLRRHRVDDDEPLSRGIFEYRNTGLQVGINYDRCWISADVHIGYAGSQDLKVINCTGSSSIHYKFESAPYAGGKLAIRF